METHKSKRQKVTIACDACRSRKAKCDGNEPVCGPCRRRSGKSAVACTWSASSRLHTSNSHIRQLQDRIAELENAQRETSAAPSRLNVAEPTISDQYGEAEHVLQPGGSPESIRAANHGGSHGSGPSPIYTAIGPTIDEENSEGFFGSSSAGTFMQNVSVMVEQRLHGGRISRSRFLLAPGGHRKQPCLPQRQSIERDHEEMSLPLRRTADELMRVYWESFHPLFPVLDKQQMEEEYQCLWTGQTEIEDQQSLLCLVNAVFAVSAQLSPNTAPQDRVRLAAQYYTRAENLLNVFEEGSIRTVQSLLLLSMYCQSSSNAHQCWIFMGLAVRFAQGLGLHRPDASERETDDRRRELLRRVWYGCVLLDQVVASTCGRPTAIGVLNSTAVPFPSRIEAAEPAAITDHFNHSVKLCRILHDTVYSLCSPLVSRVQSLDELYDHYFGHNPQDPSKPSVFDVERDLKSWRESIPEYLKLDASGQILHDDIAQERALHHRLAVALQQHYLHVRLLLLRPFISAVITFEPTSTSTSSTPCTTSLSWDISLQCAVACAKAAQDVISLVHSQRLAQPTKVGNTAYWWFNILFIYTAATVLIASLLSPSIADMVPEASILASWHSALEILDGYMAFGPSITRLVTTLQVLFDMVPKQHSQRQRQNQQLQPPLQDGSRSQIAQTEPEDDDRTVRWRVSPPPAVPTPLSGYAGGSATIMEQHLAFTPLPAGIFDGPGDPFDLAWLTDLPPDLSF